MPDINLLPNDQRQREAKELKREAKKPKVFEIELSNPAKDKPVGSDSDKQKRSIWSRIFGVKKNRPMTSMSNAMPRPADFGAKIDLLSSAKKQKVYFKGAMTTKIQPLEFAPKPKLFGRPRSPIKTSFRPQPQFQSYAGGNKIIRPQAVEIKIAKPRLSFWQRFFQRRQRKPKPIVFTPPRFNVQAPKPMLKPSVDARLSRQEVVKETKSHQQAPKLVAPKPPKPKRHLWQRFLSLFKSKPTPAKIDPVYKDYQAKSPTKKEKDTPKFHMPAMNERAKINVDFIPQELAVIKHHGWLWRIIMLLIMMIIPSLIIGGLYFGLDYLQQQVDAQISAKSSQIDNLKTELGIYRQQYQQNIAFEKRLYVVKDIYDRHIYWTNFLAFLEKYTLDGVYYTKFSADTSGLISLPAVADNYDTLAKQIVALSQAKDFVAEVKVDHAKIISTSQEGKIGVAFELKIVLAEGVFSKQ